MFRTIAGVEVELRIVGDMQTSRTVQILSIDSKLVEPPISVVLADSDWNDLINISQQRLGK